jgi:uncharacterized Zn-finger protein
MKINRVIVAVLLLVSCSLIVALPAAEEKAARPSRACKNSDGSLKCSYCDKRFARHGDLKKHEMDHESLCLLEIHDDIPVNMSASRKRAAVDKSNYSKVCQECGTKWCSVTALNVHMRSHNGIKPYQCRYCPSNFSVNTTRQRHELSHSGAQPFSCDLCEKKFTRKESMQVHRRLHTGEKPYRCNEPACNESFRILHELKQHQHDEHTAPEQQVNRRTIAKRVPVSPPNPAAQPVVADLSVAAVPEGNPAVAVLGTEGPDFFEGTENLIGLLDWYNTIISA